MNNAGLGSRTAGAPKEALASIQSRGDRNVVTRVIEE
jgi:hypothetical protein